jgi:hypothetical protein
VHGDFISLKDVLAQMDSGEPFSIVFITCDQRKGTGGEIITVEKAYKQKWLSPEERKQQQLLQPASNIIKKHPRHYENSTRNIRLASNGDIRKVHIRLIRKFNGKTVL